MLVGGATAVATGAQAAPKQASLPCPIKCLTHTLRWSWLSVRHRAGGDRPGGAWL